MNDLRSLCRQPIFFERNRVFRVYRGGKLFRDFFGDADEDNNYPEEWVASQVKALNRDQSDPAEGLSFVEGTRLTFCELLEKQKAALLGDTPRFDILVKLLDSAIRLPIQAHPDKPFSRKYLNSEYGKTEMWLILQTRPDACIYFGFKDKIDKKTFAELVEKSKTDKDAMVPFLNRIDVKAGDVYLIPAKTVHAIGAGCLLLEVQEPTDFTIQPEYWCGDYRLNEYEMYLGLGKDIALDCFVYDKFGEGVALSARKMPRVIKEMSGYRAEQLIGSEDTPCFRVFRHTWETAETKLASAPALYIVTEGNGTLTGENYERPVQKGDYFFLPHAAKELFSMRANGSVQCVECAAPVK